jgi:hypothetical protein
MKIKAALLVIGKRQRGKGERMPEVNRVNKIKVYYMHR